MRQGIIIAIILAAVTTAFAGDTKKLPRPLPPLPQAVLDAKTIYVDNQGTDARLTARANAEIKQWGRLTVIDDRTKADVTLVISTQLEGTNDLGDKYGTITMQLFIPHDDIPQFSSTLEDGIRFMERDVTKSIKLLRKRIEDQVAAAAGSGATGSGATGSGTTTSK